MLSCFLVLALSTQIITWDALENRTPDDICKLYEDNYVFQKTGNCYTEGEGCQYGTQSAEDIDHTTRRINFYRVITGLLPTTTGTEEVYRDNVNQACIIMQKNKIFSHSLTNTSLECWSQSGQTGAASSNIYYASVNTCSTSSISAYMGSLGHRRWVLHPPLISAYASVVGGYSALKVFGMPNNGSAEAFFIAYPPPGPVPYNVIYNSWSFGRQFNKSSTALYNMPEDSKVTLKCDCEKKSITYTLRPSNTANYQGIVSFDGGTLQPGHFCNVVISSKSADTEWRYTVNAINCTNGQAYNVNPKPKCKKELSGGAKAAIAVVVIVVVVAIIVGVFIYYKKVIQPKKSAANENGFIQQV